MYGIDVETARSNTFGITLTLSRPGKVLADRHAGRSVDFSFTTARVAQVGERATCIVAPESADVGGTASSDQVGGSNPSSRCFNPNRFRGDSGLP